MIIFIIFILLLAYKYLKPMNFHNINDHGNLRNCDPLGCGHFGASRGTKTHKGLDFQTVENQHILAPFDCKIIRYGKPYADEDYKLVEIQGLNNYKSYKAKLMYIKTLYPIGQIIPKGSVLCTSDDISKLHGSQMITHVHFELYKNNTIINPETFF